jgi:hypothetical protein
MQSQRVQKILFHLTTNYNVTLYIIPYYLYIFDYLKKWKWKAMNYQKTKHNLISTKTFCALINI